MKQKIAEVILSFQQHASVSSLMEPHATLFCNILSINNPIVQYLHVVLLPTYQAPSSCLSHQITVRYHGAALGHVSS